MAPSLKLNPSPSCFHVPQPPQMDSLLPLPASQLARLIPLTLALCSVCQSSGVWAICPTCQRILCPTCQPSTSTSECVGCALDAGLLKDELPEPVKQSIDAATRLLRTAASSLESAKNLNRSPSYPLYPIPGQQRPAYMVWEGTLQETHSVQLPSEHQWQQSEFILQDFIHFTMGQQKPIPEYRYIVGRYIYPNSYPVITDYMLCYESDPTTGTYHWMRYISTFYDKSPCPYNGNIFYPAPLPISVIP